MKSRAAHEDALRAEYEALSRGDWGAVLRHAHPDFELKTPDQAPFAGTYYGPDAARQAFEDFFAPFEEVVITPEEFFERGEQVVVFFLQRSRPRGSSRVVEVRAGHLWTMRDHRPARCEIFPQREKALEAAGMR
jgi:ketosteroid isomerase-like protein